MSKRSTMAHMEDFFYRELLKYLMLAEEKRRWNVFKDIPWDKANGNSEDTLAHCVETFCAVEMYLPDFTSKLLHMIRQSRGRSWFHINWGYEESKHSLALEAWLLASGHRTEEQRAEVEKLLLGFEWELPYDHPRQMVCYTMIQELATFWNYRNLEKIAAQNHDLALITALRVISVDERVHYNFFRNIVKEWMKLDEAGTVEDLKYVFDHFSMPGRSQIPNYEESARILAKTGIYGPREYIKLVKNPILEDLKLDKDFHKMEARNARDDAAREAKKAAEQREQIAVGNGNATARDTTAKEFKSSDEPEGRPTDRTSGKPTPFNSHAVAGVLSNLKGANVPPTEQEDDGPKKSPFLQAIGIEPQRRAPSQSIIMPWDADRLPGSRGMDGYNDLDQRLIIEGDEKSNNDDEMRQERAEIRRNRVKNQRLFNKYNNEGKK
jgi:acyl-[acyl-carrier-protein] desaturase